MYGVMVPEMFHALRNPRAVFLLTVAPRRPAGGTAAGGVAAAVRRVLSTLCHAKKRKRTIRRCGTDRLHIRQPAHGVAASQLLVARYSCGVEGMRLVVSDAAATGACSGLFKSGMRKTN